MHSIWGVDGAIGHTERGGRGYFNSRHPQFLTPDSKAISFSGDGGEEGGLLSVEQCWLSTSN